MENGSRVGFLLLVVTVVQVLWLLGSSQINKPDLEATEFGLTHDAYRRHSLFLVT